MMEDKLLEAIFEMKRWEELINRAEEKGINKSILKRMSSPEERLRLLDMIVNNQYQVAPPHIARIPKDEPNEFREVVVCEDCDRIVLSLINDALFELFGSWIHPKSKAYQKGIGCAEVVQEVSKKIQESEKNTCGYKADLSKYFASVNLDWIENVFNSVEEELGFDYETEPVMNLLRRFYRCDLEFDFEGNLVEHYESLKQGCSVSSFLANVVLYDIDNALSKMDIIYVRYSDDILMIGKDAERAKAKLEEMLPIYGLRLNPRKVEAITKDKWFTFLGFKICGDKISLSRNRTKKFQKEIESRTIKHRKISAKQAKNNVMKYLYEGNYNWATSCLSVINVKPDIDELNKFIMDCIRACETGKKKIGGLGSVNNLPDRTIVRGKGKNVKSNRERTTKEIEDYFSVGCLSNAMKISKPVFEAIVRSV